MNVKYLSLSTFALCKAVMVFSGTMKKGSPVETSWIG